MYLIGTTGHPNYGDELIAAGWLRFLAQAAPEAEVWLDSPRPGRSEVLLGGIHPNLRCVDTLYHACWNAPTDSPEATLEYGERVIGEPGLIPREATGVEDLSRVDLVHIIGGGYINSIWPSHLALIGATQGIAQRYEARTAITGAALTPLVEASLEPLGRALATFDVFDARDEATFEALSPFVPQATNGVDDAFLTIGDRLLTRNDVVGTMLCLQADLTELPLNVVAQYVIRTLQYWGVDQEPVTLVDCLPPNDGEILEYLSPALPDLSLITFARLWRQGFPVNANQRWISTRFHPHLLAAAAGSWGVAIPISKDYYRTKHESLTKLGSGWDIAPDLVDPLPPRALDAPFGGKLSALTDDKLAVAKSVEALIR